MKIFGKNIQFYAEKSVLDILGDIKPQPSSKFLPEYYKNANLNVVKPKERIAFGPNHSFNGKVGNHFGFKACVPYMDAIMGGYTIPLWSDVIYDKTNESFYLSHNQVEDQYQKNTYALGVLSTHSYEQVKGIPGTKESEITFKYLNPWKIKTPPGYSCLFIQPMNHFDSRYQIVSGIVDTDTYTESVHFPFIINRNNMNDKDKFERGMPFVQVIPFKRENWKMDLHPMTNKERSENRSIMGILSSMTQYAYRKMWWKKKKYE